MRVILIQSPSWGVECPPYGIAVLKAYLQERGHYVRAMDLNLELYQMATPSLKEQWRPECHQFWMDPVMIRNAFEGELRPHVEKIIEKIVALNPQVIGFSVLFSNEQAALILARELKNRLSRCTVVFGGPQASRDAGGEKIVASGVVDYAVEGEGELIFSKFLELLEDGKDPTTVSGLLFIREGQMINTGPHSLVPDLSSLPFADYSDFPMQKYQQIGCIPVSLSRGCPNKCAFCYEVQYWKRFRIRKAESLFKEVLNLKQTMPFIDFLWFHDSLINGHMGELKKFAQYLIDLRLPTPWASQAVIRKEMTKDVLKLLKDSGCVSLNYGLESASFSTMLRMGKVLAKGSAIDQIVRDTTESGIDCVLNFMFGFPGETEGDFQITLDFVRRNKEWISMVQPSPGFCDFYKGTYGYKHPEEFGIKLREGSAHWVSDDGQNTYLTRMERFERFLDMVYSLGIKCSYPQRTLYLKHTITGNYYFSYGQYKEAIPYLEKARDYEPYSDLVRLHLEECYQRMGCFSIKRD